MADRIVVLDRGLIAQVGTPLELYDQPANRFVAEFIGSPAINVLPGEANGSRLTLRVGDEIVEETLPQAVPEREVDVGIRPEHLSRVETGGIPGAVQVIEHLGAETYVFVDIGAGRDVCWRSSGRPDLSIGDRLRLGFDAKHLHIFGKADGNRLA